MVRVQVLSLADFYSEHPIHCHTSRLELIMHAVVKFCSLLGCMHVHGLGALKTSSWLYTIKGLP